DHLIHSRGDISHTPAIRHAADGSYQIAGQPMRLVQQDDLRTSATGNAIPLTYLPRAVRGGRITQFAGRQMIWFGSRLYLPELEIFSSPDPVLPAPFAPAAYNRYR